MKLADAPKLPGWLTLGEFAQLRGVTKQAGHKMASDGKFTTLHRVGAKPTYVIAETEAKALLAKQHGPARVLIVPGVKPTRDAVAYAVQWCRATRERRSPFTTEMDRQSPELAAWAKGGYQGISWPKGRAVPTKEMIAAFLERKLAGGDH